MKKDLAEFSNPDHNDLRGEPSKLRRGDFLDWKGRGELVWDGMDWCLEVRHPRDGAALHVTISPGSDPPAGPYAVRIALEHHVDATCNIVTLCKSPVTYPDICEAMHFADRWIARFLYVMSPRD